ncbi:hypothetical protein IXB50_02180 [Leptothoe spongobia TAU-MAC 1115]|uniref:Uncharacterized protein n=1 Tax=Leptothoe spongobia TAU-MAC 1115 TaxID=1967444 RepID=A0A947DBS1_9CYAN|nr:hypothetical protein [Leptothoe spongobia TAU-MAC 1115]
MGYFAYGQLPVFPAYPSPPSLAATDVFTPIPNLLDAAISDSNGTTFNSDGTVFNGIPGYNPVIYFASGGSTLIPTGRTLSATANTGYAGFTNYTVDFDNIDFNDIEGSLNFQTVNNNFPTLDSGDGFTIAFDLAILNEVSESNRAGFSVVLVSDDVSKEVEIGFKTDGADRAFAQSANFTEAETSSATSLDFSIRKTYWLSISGNTYSLAANGVEILSGNTRDYNFDPTTSSPALPASANPYQTPNFLFLGDNTDQGHAQFTLGEVQVLSLQTSLTPDLYNDYIASYGDLITALGNNLEAGKSHYLTSGFQEGRQIDLFEEDIYIASYSDLIINLGYNPEAATNHFISQGFREGRSANLFIPELYLAAYQDLQNAFGSDLKAATRHYIESGFSEGRDPLLGFDARAYIASYNDLIAAFGDDFAAGRNHYLQDGYNEGRTVTFQADDYIASYSDLITTLGYNLDLGAEHYITMGVGEGRSADLFDEAAYLSKYSDLQAVFGNNLEAATRHYIEVGYFEGRTV